MKTPFLLLALALVLAPSAQATNEAAFQGAFSIFEKARGGDSDSIDASQDAFDQLVRHEPDNPLLRAYLGAAETLQGRHALLPWNKMKYTENGLANIDKALQQLEPLHDRKTLRGVPIALETRLVAASTLLAMPGMFNRSPSGHQQLQALLAHPGLLKAPDGFRKAVVNLALQTARNDKLPAEHITRIQKIASGSEAERKTAQVQIKGIWK